MIWVGVIALLKNLEIIPVINWTFIWPFILIIIGSSLKYFKHGMVCGMGGKCGMCAGGKCGGEGVCEGPNCKH